MDQEEEEEEKVVTLPLLKLISHYSTLGVKYGCITGVAISPIVSQLKLPVPKACKEKKKFNKSILHRQWIFICILRLCWL
jgi:hypothetical protein